MLLLVLAQKTLPVMVIVWFFNLFGLNGQDPDRFGPYLTEGTCEAVRAKVLARSDRQAGASECFKSAVQENDQLSSN